MLLAPAGIPVDGLKFRVEPISWFKMLYAKNSYRGISTILYNIPRIPFVFAGNLLKLRKIVGDFRPDIVISDFDVNGIYIAKLSGLPVITISNMHMMDYEKPRLSTSEKIGFLLTQESMLKSFVGTDHFIIMHLIKPKQGKKGVDFFYPIVRQSVTSATPDDKGYFLVYSSAAQLPALLPVLEKFPAWQKLTAKQKSVAAFLLIAGSPFLSEGLVALTKSISPETLTVIQHYLDLGLTGVRLWAASQYAHGGLRQLVQPK